MKKYKYLEINYIVFKKYLCELYIKNLFTKVIKITKESCLQLLR